VLYIRYSSEMQKESWSLEAQVNELRAYCDRQGWDVVDVCKDEAISGSKVDRPGFQRALALVRDARANSIIVHKLDRFFRGVEETFRYIDDLEQHGAGLVCIQ
jgi:site-specific DNA recombinase